MAIHIGHRRAGFAGLIVAGLAFILPAAAIVTAIAAAYVRWGRLPVIAAVLYGIKPVMVAIVVHALWGLGKVAVKGWGLALLGVASLSAVLLGQNELLVLLVAGVLALAVAAVPRRAGGVSAVFPWLAAAGPGLGGALHVSTAASPIEVTLPALFGLFVKIGSVLFGSGYVLLAFLRAELCERRGWLTEGQLLDAIAVGQLTPGPVFTTASFVGYLLAGGAGAFVATAGIFLPAFIFVALSGPLVPRLRKSRLAGAFLDGVNVASLALMAAVSWQLGQAALVDVVSCLLGVAAAALLLVAPRVSSGWLVLAGAAVGWLVRMVAWS